MPEELIDEIIGKKYDIKAKLGKGGSGIVYLAKKLNTNERYAIKTLSTDEDNAIKLLERETETLKRLNHPNIVKFIEQGYEKRHRIVYLVLEYLDGQNIKDYFDNGIDIKTKLNIFLQIIDAISHAHSKNIIHRDIKPDNIQIVDTEEEPQAKVLDFGIAIITTTILTNTIRSYHTPLFSAPEQINLQGVSRDSDIYSLGMTFLYLLSTQEARINFQDQRNKEILYRSSQKILKGDGNSQKFLNILLKATDVNRKNRPKLDQLRKVIADLIEELADTIDITFKITNDLQTKIDQINNYQGQGVKIKKHIESKLTDDQGILYIKKSTRKSNELNRLMLDIYIETSDQGYQGFINTNEPDKIIIIHESEDLSVKQKEIIVENGIRIKIYPIIDIGDVGRKRKTDLSDLVDKLLKQEKVIKNEIENKQLLEEKFEQWQSVIDLEKEIVSDKKQVFNYKKFDYDQDRQILILTLTEPISIKIFYQITSPPLPVTISTKAKPSPQKESQYSIGDITDGDKSSDGESIVKLHISIGDFFDPEIIGSILERGKIETNFKDRESEIEKRRKALREIRYGDAENQNLRNIIVNPSKVKLIESVKIDSFFNEQLDESQQKAVCKSLATEDIFLIQGPPGTGKTSVITEIILQILDQSPNDKILISSQSNVAVDNVLTMLPEDKIKCIRIGREEKIEEYAKKFQVEKSILEWQKSIISKSLDYWQKYREKNEQMLSGSLKKMIELEKFRNKNQDLKVLAKNLTGTIAKFNSQFIIYKDNLASIEFSDIAIELIAEKLELEQEILKLVEEYTSEFGIEYPEEKELSVWIDQESKVLKSILGEDQENYQNFVRLKELNKEWNERLKRKQESLFPFFMDEINVIGATCLGIARFKHCNFDWVIIDEAARSTAPETFVPMSRGKKIILVGDHKQLPPIIDQELEKRALGEKDFSKKILEMSLFEYLYEKLPDNNKITLNNQYRMHPDIGNLVSNIFYDNQVVSSLVDIQDKQHNLTIFEKNVYWLSTSDAKQKFQEKRNGNSRNNKGEAELINKVLQKIEKDCESNSLHKEVGVISAYRSQINILEDHIKPNNKELWKNSSIIIHTVDAFQGRECDIIIYDLVRSNPQKELGFTSDDRRLNVALSRAKQLLIIVGDDNMAYQGKTPKNISNPFQPLIEYIDENNDCNRLESSKFMK